MSHNYSNSELLIEKLLESENIPKCNNIAFTMDIYKETKEIYELTTQALGRNIEFTVDNSSTQNVNISAHGQLPTATTH
ncbi:MAG TPA: hypothetical protein PKC54_13055 [Ferruginibacter sp.]|nr:hypothetical protein [Ferruginibacter sp.]